MIGLTLLTGRFLRFGLVVLAGALVGIMSPLVLFADQLYGNGPTLTAVTGPGLTTAANPQVVEQPCVEERAPASVSKRAQRAASRDSEDGGARGSGV